MQIPPPLEIPPRGHPFRFKPEKVIEALIIIANGLPRSHRSQYYLGKLLFFADQKHLADYSRYITGDCYVAMNEGPVPSQTYNLMKQLAGREQHGFQVDETAFRVNTGHPTVFFLDPLRDSNSELLSRSDVECLNWALETYGSLGKTELGKIVHEDPAYVDIYDSNRPNLPIDIPTFARHMDGGQRLVDLLTGVA